MLKKMSDIKSARLAKRQKSGWSVEEIKSSALKSYRKNREIAKNEPAVLISGSLKEALKGDDRED
jgi:hypothetical protein